jgi:arylsulfatase A-like enzyme
MRRRSRWRDLGASALVLALTLSVLGCRGAPDGPNFILLSIDTLRADHLGCYGYDRNTSPNIDRLAGRSVRFDQARASTPWTLPSHVEMLTGRHPADVGIVDYESSIPADVTLLAEPLSAAGYRTAAFVDGVSDGFVGGARGFARGFASYAHAPHGSGTPYRYDMARTVDAATRWLEEHDPDVPFFLFLHTKSVHDTPKPVGVSQDRDAPYDKPEPYRSRFLPGKRLQYAWRDGGKRGARYLRAVNERIAEDRFDEADFPPERIEELIALYDGGIYYTDEHFGRLLDALGSLELERNTVVIVTSDHGEAFRDHQFFLHNEVYDALIRIPLIVHDPARPPGSVARPVLLADIAPTILSRAGLAIPDEITGRPLPFNDAGPREERPVFSYFHFKDDYFYSAFSLREGPWKLVYHKRSADPGFRADLYDTRADPDERSPIRGEGARAGAMLTRLLPRVEAVARSRSETISLRPDTVEHLRALGYLE